VFALRLYMTHVIFHLPASYVNCRASRSAQAPDDVGNEMAPVLTAALKESAPQMRHDAGVPLGVVAGLDPATPLRRALHFRCGNKGTASLSGMAGSSPAMTESEETWSPYAAFFLPAFFGASFFGFSFVTFSGFGFSAFTCSAAHRMVRA
jgi:hypothetical protein